MTCKLILVLGMHRSGTSAVAGYLNSLGFAVPSRSLPAHPDDNPDGYFEPAEAVQLNNGVLRRLAQTWQSTDPLPPGFEHSLLLTAEREAIEAYLARVCKPDTRLVLKDPRLSRLLPLWLPAIERHCGAPLVVNSLRSPAAVAASLSRRASHEAIQGAAITDHGHATLLWLRYCLDAWRHLRILSAPHLTLNYEGFAGAPDVQRELLDLIGRRWPELSLDARGASAFVRAARANPAPADTATRDDWHGLLEAAHRAFLKTSATDEAWLERLDQLVSVAIPAPLQARETDAAVPPELLAAARIKHVSGQMLPGAHGERPGLGERLRRLVVRPPRHWLFVSEAPATRAHIYRVKNPVDALSRSGQHAHWLTLEAAVSSRNAVADAAAIVVHRCQWSPALEGLYRQARNAGVRVIYDIDDRVFEPELIDQGQVDFIRRMDLPQQREWRQRFQRYREALMAADAALVPTPALADAVTAVGVACAIKPNGMSPETLSLAAHWRAHSLATGGTGQARTPRLGYASGTATHEADFATVVEPLIAFLDANPDWCLTLIGSLDCAELARHIAPERIERRPLVEHINLGFELARLTANLAPLEPDNAFCAGKSPLKWFEAAACGVPTLASGSGAFAQWIEHGTDGLLARNTGEWQTNLGRLTADPAGVQRIAEAALDRVRRVLCEDALLPGLRAALEGQQ